MICEYWIEILKIIIIIVTHVCSSLYFIYYCMCSVVFNVKNTTEMRISLNNPNKLKIIYKTLCSGKPTTYTYAHTHSLILSIQCYGIKLEWNIVIALLCSFHLYTRTEQFAILSLFFFFWKAITIASQIEIKRENNCLYVYREREPMW